mmetsp:Transcript_99493/g.285812  ORF Transcript_99493/g.285812 Transcript_99493/m.285812 type:complete len:152 (+) Transcript_99493:154-609(+)
MKLLLRDKGYSKVRRSFDTRGEFVTFQGASDGRINMSKNNNSGITQIAEMKLVSYVVKHCHTCCRGSNHILCLDSFVGLCQNFRRSNDTTEFGATRISILPMTSLQQDIFAFFHKLVREFSWIDIILFPTSDAICDAKVGYISQGSISFVG